MMKVVPVTIALGLVFTVLSHFWACNPGKPWWRKRELITDICYGSSCRCLRASSASGCWCSAPPSSSTFMSPMS